MIRRAFQQTSEPSEEAIEFADKLQQFVSELALRVERKGGRLSVAIECLYDARAYDKELDELADVLARVCPPPVP